MSSTSTATRSKRRAETQSAPGEASVPKRQKKQNTKDASDKGKVEPKLRKNAKRGRLALLLQMPVDVFYEIARNLTPKEILTLARATKSWRKLLMNPESTPIWRAARDNVGLPECPDDLSEPKYADLVYGRGCMLCSSEMARNVYFAFRLRLCKSCYQNNIGVGANMVSANLGSDPKEEFLYLLAPYQFVNGIGPIFSEQVKYGLVWFWRKDFVKMLEKYKSLHGDEKEGFIEKRKERAEKINTHARAVEKWCRDQEKKKREENKSIGRQRRAEIFSRLKKMGYTDEDLRIHCEERWHVLIGSPKPLTERIWKNIRPELERIIESEKNSMCECREYESSSNCSEDDAPNEVLHDGYY